VTVAFEPLPEPHPASEILLPRQNPALGGAATRPPFRPDRDAEKAVARAAASLRSRQQATLSGATSATARAGGLEYRQQPHQQQQSHHQQAGGGSRLARSLSTVKDSLTEGASWLWNTPNPGASPLSVASSSI
jgi:hypothetical protein